MSSPKFSMEWQALKLLGKSLYSNPWVAISELTANGIDAGASEIYVHLDLRKGKGDAILEVLDNGVGMGLEGINNYVKIGYNKRLSAGPTEKPMGRKGIGKLAALYLSDSYFIHTKTNHSTSLSWSVEVPPPSALEQGNPRLIATKEKISSDLYEKYQENPSGTLIQIYNINLVGYGHQAFASLKNKLGSQFLINKNINAKIYIKISEENKPESEYRLVERKVAFNNLLVIYSLSPIDMLTSDVIKYYSDESKVKVFFQNREYIKTPIKKFVPEGKTSGKEVFYTEDNRDSEIDYKVDGWVGIHSTIDNLKASQNDELFTRSRHHSPCQIRLYVRNKLAIENLSPYLGMTAASLNYVEGEIYFDLLDDDHLPDIATTNRQSFDETDFRFTLLIEKIRSVVSDLIREREVIMKEVKKTADDDMRDKYSRAKQIFSKEVHEDISNYIPNKEYAAELALNISSKIQGDVQPKQHHSIFISHASKDKVICDLIYNLLIAKGATDDEIFYTSKEQTGSLPTAKESLAVQIKNSIIDSKTKIVYFPSKNFNGSIYCLFEAGAGWATKGVQDIELLPVEYKEIPDFINNGQKQSSLVFKEKKVALNRTNYYLFIDVANQLIEHLNKGRSILNKEPIGKIDGEVPREMNLESGKTIEDYMDETFLKLWKQSNISEYVVERKKKKKMKGDNQKKFQN